MQTLNSKINMIIPFIMGVIFLALVSCSGEPTIKPQFHVGDKATYRTTTTMTSVSENGEREVVKVIQISTLSVKEANSKGYVLAWKIIENNIEIVSNNAQSTSLLNDAYSVMNGVEVLLQVDEKGVPTDVLNIETIKSRMQQATATINKTMGAAGASIANMLSEILLSGKK